MKKIIKYPLIGLSGIIVGIPVMLLLICLILYLPPVQSWGKERIGAAVRSSGIELSIETLALKFPFDLSLNHFSAVAAASGDTLVYGEELRVRISLPALLRGKAEVKEVRIQKAGYGLQSADSGLSLQADLKQFSLHGTSLSWIKKEIVLDSVSLHDTDVSLILHTNAAKKDTATTPSSIPWAIRVKRLCLNRTHYRMRMSPTIEDLEVRIDSIAASTGEVRLDRSSVSVQDVTIQGGKAFYLAGKSTAPQDTTASADSTTTGSTPWLIDVERIRCFGLDGTYAIAGSKPSAGFDPEYISVRNLSLAVDSFSNYGSTIRLPLRQLALQERSGISIEKAQGLWQMTDSTQSLQNFTLATPYSVIQADADFDTDLFKNLPHARIQADIRIEAALSDLARGYPGAKEYTSGLHPGSRVSSHITLSGTAEQIRLDQLKLRLPELFDFSAHGSASRITSPHQRQAHLAWEGSLLNPALLRQLLYGTPTYRRADDTVALYGDIRLRRDSLTAGLTCRANGGDMQIDGGYDLTAQNYTAQVKAVTFPIAEFLPGDEFGMLSADLRCNGSRFDLYTPQTSANIDLNVSRFDFRNVPYRIALQGNYTRQQLNARIASEMEALNCRMGITATIAKERYSGQIDSHITHADLHALRLLSDSLTMSGELSLNADFGTDEIRFRTNDEIRNLTVNYNGTFLQSKQIAINATGDRDSTRLSYRDGDFSLLVRSGDSPDTLLHTVPTIAPAITEMVERGRADVKRLNELLPDFSGKITGKKQNIVYQFLSSRGVKLPDIQWSIGKDSVFHTDARLLRMETGGVMFDTITAQARIASDRLYYGLQVGNRPGNLDALASVRFDGYVSGSDTRLFCRQHDGQGREGFRFGSQVGLKDSTVTVSLFPERPIIGYESWQLNPDNSVSYRIPTRLFEADVRLVNGDKFLKISTGSETARGETLLLNLSGMELAAWTELSPFLPPISGILGGNIRFSLANGSPDLSGSLSIDTLAYNRKRIGDIAIRGNYHTDEHSRQHLNARLAIDTVPVVTANGTIDSLSGFDIHTSITALPLSAANAFMPAQTATFSGRLNGDISVGGTSAQPLLNGNLQWDNASASVTMTGTTITLSGEPIPIENNTVYFRNFAILGANRKPLSLNGTVTLDDFADPYIRLTASASEFQPIRVERKARSAIFGTALVDLNASLNGRVSLLKIRGNLSLLEGTNVTYVLQDSPLEVKQQPNNLVTFVSFADTTAIDESEILPPSDLSGMDIQVGIEIAPSVKMGINLSNDGSNRIDLQGGGSLTYTLNPLGDSRFSGKYTLTGGFVRYNPPIISEKLFQISSGSSVTWNGNIADPILDITAVEELRANVTESDGTNRPVNFDLSIIIRNRLENLDISFDVTTHDDLTIQNQLAALSPEQRSSQAMNLLIYNTYTGPGTTAKASVVGNPLNAFIQKELNQWAQNNLKGIDLSFGIRSYGDEIFSQHTDYTYRVSKSFYNDRIQIIIGGSYSTGDNSEVNLKENLIDDVTLQYRLTKRENMYLRVFRRSGYESILEGEVIQTGVGFMIRKQLPDGIEEFKLRKMLRRKEEE